MTRRRGFTLIELLVVIAIIGILAAMLFPVFARARESARKTQCLANVKNIALAINMYFTDYDRFPPMEHRKEVLAYFDAMPGANNEGDWNGEIQGHCGKIRDVNPYLRWPVILDDYTKNRDIWKCPSAKLELGATWIYPVEDWFGFVKAHPEVLDKGGPCDTAYPRGWGGEITDSSLQGEATGIAETAANQAFVMSIGVNANNLYDKSTANFNDASAIVVVADAGVNIESLFPGQLAYPDLCTSECGNTVCGWADWANCSSWAADCGLYNYNPKDGSLYRNESLLKTYARHLGGDNLGFADGHAKWYAARAILADYLDGRIEAMWNWGPTSANKKDPTCQFYIDNPEQLNEPTLY